MHHPSDQWQRLTVVRYFYSQCNMRYFMQSSSFLRRLGNLSNKKNCSPIPRKLGLVIFILEFGCNIALHQNIFSLQKLGNLGTNKVFFPFFIILGLNIPLFVEIGQNGFA
eukprot:TRINITY_DN23324_c0_g1_i1.p1 TRINITY_DN23324_c0_g1~~TRINITY_DN23324_c0_g1_i1.p1  ORF type:complete len:110 (-),score=6.86 TRINITY_DN23324_c0_g1_i1:37-366(-)